MSLVKFCFHGRFKKDETWVLLHTWTTRCGVTGNETNKKTLPVRLAASLVQITKKNRKKKKIQIFHYCWNVNRVVSISKFPNKFARLKIWINVNIRGLFFALALVMADDVPCSWRVLSLSKINRSVFEHLMTHQGVHYQKWRNRSKDSEFFLYWIVFYNHQSERESIKAFHGRINLVAGGTCWHLSVFLKIRTETLTEILFSWR